MEAIEKKKELAKDNNNAVTINTEDIQWQNKLQGEISSRKNINTKVKGIKIRNRGVIGNLARKVIGPEGFFAMQILLYAEKKQME